MLRVCLVLIPQIQSVKSVSIQVILLLFPAHLVMLRHHRMLPLLAFPHYLVSDSGASFHITNDTGILSNKSIYTAKSRLKLQMVLKSQENMLAQLH